MEARTQRPDAILRRPDHPQLRTITAPHTNFQTVPDHLEPHVESGTVGNRMRQIPAQFAVFSA